jgi:hypothetical protein
MSCVGIGALTGALTLATIGNRGQRGRLLVLGNLMLPTALIVFANSRLFFCPRWPSPLPGRA